MADARHQSTLLHRHPLDGFGRALTLFDIFGAAPVVGLAVMTIIRRGVRPFRLDYRRPDRPSQTRPGESGRERVRVG